MARQKKTGFEVPKLIGDIPDLFLFLIAEDLRLLWKFPSHPARDEEEILGSIRENLVTAFQEEGPRERKDEASVLIRTFNLKREGEPGKKYLLTLKRRGGDEPSETTYMAMVQNVAACAGNPFPNTLSSPRETVPVQTVRKLLHEISNPLSVISGYTEYMLAGMPEADEKHSFLKEIFDNTLRLRNIIGRALEEGKKERKEDRASRRAWPG